MEDDRFDKRLTDALHKGTQTSQQLKDEVYDNIIKKIADIDPKDKKATHSKALWHRKIIGIGTAAAVLLLTLAVSFQPGQAAIKKIREFFDPFKSIEQEIEGMDEDTDVVLKESKMGYIIYYDTERYTIDEEEDLDRIVTVEKFDYVPEVFMEIRQIEDQAPEALARELEAQLNLDFIRVDAPKTVEQPLEAIYIYANQGIQWNDIVQRIYIVDNTQGGSFVIRQQFFIEAEEGHGVRLDNMLKEFRIISLDEP